MRDWGGRCICVCVYRVWCGNGKKGYADEDGDEGVRYD
jgi:hypothetical protein